MIVLGVLFIAVIIFGYLLINSNDNNKNSNINSIGVETNNNASANINSNSNNNTISDIQITSPLKNDSITSPLQIEGEARGSWFFEASFPVQIVDDDGNQLGYGSAQAVGDWQTNDFVDFMAQITFENGNKSSGFLVLQNDNPSGLEDLKKEIRIPVNFSIAEKNTVQIFLGKESAQQSDCSIVSPVNRSFEKTPQIATATINQLLAGPTIAEKTGGYVSSINTSTRLISLDITNGTAHADFSAGLNNIAGSCAVQMARAQIENTLKQFSTVTEVIISINGEIEGILQP